MLRSTLLQDRFAAALLGLCEEAGVQSLRDRLMAPLLALLCRRLYRVMSQVSRVLARMQAGRSLIRRTAVSASRDGAWRETRTRPGAGAFRLGRGWAWMIRMAPRAAQYAPQIQLMLDEAEMQAALAASPSLRRAVRPLCRGLAFPAPPVLAESRTRRNAAMQDGDAEAEAAGLSCREPEGAEARAALSLSDVTVGVVAPAGPDPVARPGSSSAILLHNRHVLPAGRGSPRIAPAVFRLFTR